MSVSDLGCGEKCCIFVTGEEKKCNCFSTWHDDAASQQRYKALLARAQRLEKLVADLQGLLLMKSAENSTCREQVLLETVRSFLEGVA